MNFSRRLTRAAERYKKNEKTKEFFERRASEGILVHGAMKYKCRRCGYEWWMFIEKGLEDDNPDLKHKPVPFATTCGRCGDIAYDVSGLIEIPEEGRYHPLPEGESYFANYPEKDCGIPVLAAKDR